MLSSNPKKACIGLINKQYCLQVYKNIHVVFFHQDVQSLIVPPPEAVGQFLWQHIEADMQLMSASCGKNLDDCLFIVHLILQRIAKKKTDTHSKNFSLPLSTSNTTSDWLSPFKVMMTLCEL